MARSMDQPGMLSPRAPMTTDLLAETAAFVQPILDQFKRRRNRPRHRFDPEDVLVPEGYEVELVATGLNAPCHCCFDERGDCYVTESGHKIASPPRIVKVDVRTGDQETFLELPKERWLESGALAGACWLDGHLYFNNTATLSRVGRDGGPIEDIVTDLPGRGDHQANYPVVGPDGKLYWGQGSCTNLAVVGADDYAYEWMARDPEFHDVPGQDVTLTGRNYESPNVLGDTTGPVRTGLAETVRTGAYVPFGTETYPGQVIKGEAKCTGSIMRCNPDGSECHWFAWGFRNPYGIAFDRDGRLFATEHNIDARGRRHIIWDTEDLYEVKKGEWYGWPDFAGGLRLDDPRLGKAGRDREPVLAEHPNPHPPRPFATFEPHAGVNGLDFCREPGFGFEGDAFIALFGDLMPITGKPLDPRGLKVVRVDMRTGKVYDFAINRIQGPASHAFHGGMNRPSHCAFGPDGALYIVDWGVIRIAPEKLGIRMPLGTGALWRVRRVPGPRGDVPEPQIRVRLHLWRGLAIGALAVGGIAGAAWLLGKAVGRRES